MVWKNDYLFLFCPNFRKINPFAFIEYYTLGNKNPVSQKLPGFWDLSINKNWNNRVLIGLANKNRVFGIDRVFEIDRVFGMYCC
jgi:hypothetical protein